MHYALFSGFYDRQPWWYVDLGDHYDITKINVVNYNDPVHCPLCSKLYCDVSKHPRFKNKIAVGVHFVFPPRGNCGGKSVLFRNSNLETPVAAQLTHTKC